jgi:hypothetical protein
VARTGDVLLNRGTFTTCSFTLVEDVFGRWSAACFVERTPRVSTLPMIHAASVAGIRHVTAVPAGCELLRVDLDHPVQRFAFDNMRGGWRSHVLNALDATLRELSGDQQ